MKEDYIFSNEIKEEFEDLKGLGVHKMYQINLESDTVQQNIVRSRMSVQKNVLLS